ncbi:MAG: hypothetical protein HYS39_00820, partial [Proteobacteria bacterium]|nr:hypothetical protein [Pseudomonadota bacterium]
MLIRFSLSWVLVGVLGLLEAITVPLAHNASPVLGKNDSSYLLNGFFVGFIGALVIGAVMNQAFNKLNWSIQNQKIIRFQSLWTLGFWGGVL